MNISRLISGVVGELKTNIKKDTSFKSNKSKSKSTTNKKINVRTKDNDYNTPFYVVNKNQKHSNKIRSQYTDYEDDTTSKMRKALEKKTGKKVMSWREKISQDRGF